MAILKIRDADGNIQEILAIRGNDGKDYVLTDEDKREIAEMISGGGNVSTASVDAPDLSGYALKSDIPDLSGYALKTDLNGYALNTDIPDLSGYALKSEIPDLSEYAKKTEIPDVSNYALKSAIPDVSGFMTQTQVLALIQANMPTNGDGESY